MYEDASPEDEGAWYYDESESRRKKVRSEYEGAKFKVEASNYEDLTGVLTCGLHGIHEFILDAYSCEQILHKKHTNHVLKLGSCEIRTGPLAVEPLMDNWLDDDHKHMKVPVYAYHIESDSTPAIVYLTSEFVEDMRGKISDMKADLKNSTHTLRPVTIDFTNKNLMYTSEQWKKFKTKMNNAMAPGASPSELSYLAIALRQMYAMAYPDFYDPDFYDMIRNVKRAIYSKYTSEAINNNFVRNLRQPEYKTYFNKIVVNKIPRVVVTFPETEFFNTSASQMRFYHKVDPSGTVVWTARLGKPTPNNVHERSVEAGKALHSSVQLRTASSVKTMRQIQEAVNATKNVDKNADLVTWFGRMEERHDEREEAKPDFFPSEKLESFQNELEEILAFLTKLPKDADHYRAFKNKMRRVHEIRSSSHTWIERMKKDGDVPDGDSYYWETHTRKKRTEEEMKEHFEQAVEWERVFKDLFQKVKEQGQPFVRLSKKNIMFN